MAWKPLSIGARSNDARDGIESAAKLINCYAEELGPDAKAPFAVYAMDGAAQWAGIATSTGGARAFLALDSSLIGVIGRQVASCDVSGSSRILGGFATDGLVTMARNRRDVPQVAICCNGEVAVVEGGVMNYVTDPDLKAPTSIDCLDGYLLALRPDGLILASDLDNVTSWDALSFGKAEANPDGGVRVKVRNREALLYGTRTTEFLTDNGGDPFPFGRVTVVDIGCLAGGSVCDIEQTHAFVAHDRTVRMWDGYTPKRISTHSVERLIGSDPNKSDITGLSWTDANGHAFYAITGTDWTVVYDARTGNWHSRSSYRYGGRWRMSAAVDFAGKLLMGDFTTGKVYEVSRDFDDEDGDPIIMTIQQPPTHAWPAALEWNAVKIDLIKGVGKNTPASSQDDDPMIMHDWSTDGGHTWSEQLMLPIGRQGQKITQVIARGLGTDYDGGRTLRWSISASVARGVMGVAADLTQVDID